MTLELVAGDRVALDADVADLLARLPQAGRLQIGVRSGGVQHERLGVVGAVLRDGTGVRFAGDAHDGGIDAAAVETVVFGLGRGMRDRVLPRLELFGADAQLLMQIVGLGDESPLRSILQGVGIRPIEPPVAAEPPEPAGDPAADPAGGPFRSAAQAGAEITVEMRRPHAVSRWRGRLEEVRFSERFINLIQPTFHLHVRSGSVAGWASGVEDGVPVMAAIDAAGADLGLRVSGGIALEARP